MAQIRHIAISSDDTEKLAGFYTEVFGFRQSSSNARRTKDHFI